MNKTIYDYEIVKELGKGAFGVVYKALRKSDKKPIALKIISVPLNQDQLIPITEAEIKTLVNLANPGSDYVIRYYQSSYDPKQRQFLIEMELINGIEMFDFVTKTISDKEELYYYLLKLAKNITEGLIYSHSKGVIHNDLKLENVMVDKNTYKAKIIDYGLSCSSKHLDTWGSGCKVGGGTPNYIAPEYLNYGVRLPASDFWALGIMLYAAASGTFPYGGKTIEEIFADIKNNKSSPPPLNTPNTQLNNIVNGLLHRDPKKRLTGDQVLYLLKYIPVPRSLENTIRTGVGSFEKIPEVVEKTVYESMSMSKSVNSDDSNDINNNNNDDFGIGSMEFVGNKPMSISDTSSNGDGSSLSSLSNGDYGSMEFVNKENNLKENNPFASQYQGDKGAQISYDPFDSNINFNNIRNRRRLASQMLFL